MITFTPTANTSGPPSFAYTVSDGAGGTDTATVDVTVTAVNDPPVAVDDTGMTTAGGHRGRHPNVTMTGNDTDAERDTLTITAVYNSVGGTVDLNGDTVVTYTPTASYSGPDSFTYTVSDGNGGTATGMVTITVTPVNDLRPSTDTVTVVEDSSANAIDVLANDTDPDPGDTLHRHRGHPGHQRHRGLHRPARGHLHPGRELHRRRHLHLHHHRRRRRHGHRDGDRHRHRGQRRPTANRTCSPWPRTPPKMANNLTSAHRRRRG